MNYKKLLTRIEAHVSKHFNGHEDPDLLYHNLRHTKDVVGAATTIAKHYKLDEEDHFIVIAAAWFHDIGYQNGRAGHEEYGAKLAGEYLTKHEASDNDINRIKACILATKMPQSAVALTEKILCDADLFQVGTEKFYKNDKLLFKEYNATHSTKINKLAWLISSLRFLETHNYYTDYCQKELLTVKSQNIELLKKKIAMQQSAPEEQPAEIIPETPQAPEKKGKKNKPENIPDKGIETMFRVSSSNHQRLSDMADKKAHIMITVNSIILSAVISLVLRRLDA